MSRMSFAERILFAEDLIMYFMKTWQVRWIPGTNGKAWDGHPRRFTKAMGFLAWYAARSPWSFVKDKHYNPTFKNGYNPIDFLQYCGLVGLDSVYEYQNGRYYVVDGIVLSIVIYLGKIDQDGSFTASGGWDALAKCAEETLNKMKCAGFQLC